MTTSREPLRIPGETTWRVPPLRVPDPRNPCRPGELADYPAVRLFVERAQAVQPSFVLTSDNSSAVALICSRLDGLPLAIELAAARMRVLAPDQIVARLDGALSLLVGGSRTAPTRHQTLPATLDWSFLLLTPAEQLVFRRLAIFTGGWSLEAAEALCAGGPIDVVDVLEVLTGLVDKSLVHMRQSLGTARYGLLEAIRQYSHQKLRESDDEAALQHRHAEWWVALAEQAVRELRGAKQLQWLDRLEEEHDNLRAALRWCIEIGEAELGLRLGGALWRFWAYRGYDTEAENWLGQLLALPAAAGGSARLIVLMGAGTTAYHGGKTTIARERFEELRRLSTECGDWMRLSAALTQLGSIAMQDNDIEAAQALHTEALAIRQHHGFRWDTVISLSHLAQLDLRRGDCLSARRQWGDALAIARELEDVVTVADCLRGLAEVDLAEGNLSACRTHLHEGMSLYRSIQHARGVIMMLEIFATLAHAEHRSESAMRLFGAAARQRDAFGVHLRDMLLSEYVVAARRSAGEAVAADAWDEGYALSADQAVEEALSPPRKSGTGRGNH